jgi:hypothetical protein
MRRRRYVYFVSYVTPNCAGRAEVVLHYKIKSMEFS